MFEDVESRIARLRRYLPFDSTMEERVGKALDPLFIYHSNAIEGNTLTYSDTLYFIEEDRTPGGKKREEILEVEGQQAAIRYLHEAVRGHFELSEKLIREFHQLLTGGLPAERYEPGKYKSRDNKVRLEDGTLFPYVSFVETPAAMREFVEWHRARASELHPIEHAAQFHYRFILIHPFLDGNGRTARLLTRFVLAERGYPPIAILRTEHRDRYVQALRAVDSSVSQEELTPDNPRLNFFPVVDYLEREVLWSLDQVLDVVEGRIAVTPDDLVARFERLEQRALYARGVPLDEFQRNERIIRRVVEVTDQARELVWPSIKEANRRMREIQVTMGQGKGSLDELRAKPQEPLTYLAVRDNATPWGAFGILTIRVTARGDGIADLKVPQNQMHVIVTSEPHRLNVWVARACIVGGRWNYEADPVTWSAQMSLPIAESDLRVNDLAAFLNKQLGQFIDLVSEEISGPA